MLRQKHITPPQLKIIDSFVHRWHENFGSELILLSPQGEVIANFSPSLANLVDYQQLILQLSAPQPTTIQYQSNNLFIVPLNNETEILGYLIATAPTPQDMTVLPWAAESLITCLLDQEILHDMTDELIGAWNQLELIYHVTQNLAVSTDLKTALKSILKETQKVVDTENCFIILVGPQSLELIALEENSSSFYGATSQFNFLITQENLVLCNNKVTCRQYGAEMPDFVTSLLATPLTILQEDSRAVLGLVNKCHGQFTASDVKLIAALAQQIGVLIKNFLLHQRLIAHERLSLEREIAAKIQAALQPSQLPQMGGLSMAVSAVPASDVGGDFYDFITLDEQHITLVIGDVSGRGIQTATLTNIIRTILRAEIMRGAEPHEVIERVNNLLYQNLSQAEAFVTVLIVLIDTFQGQLKYANAGHMPAIVWQTKTHQAKQLRATSPPMGIWPHYKEIQLTHTLDIAAGDSLVLFTDGIIEAQSPNQDIFGLHRLSYIINYRASDPPELLQQYILSEVAKFRRNSSPTHPDDATLLVVKMLPQSDMVTSKNISTIIKTVDYNYTADTSYLRDISKQIIAVCREMPALTSTPSAEDFINLIELAISEICTNIMRHAYKGKKGGDIKVRITLLSNGVELDFYDYGIGFDPSTIPIPQPNVLREGGYGLHIIRQIMDVVSYHHHPEEGNHWHLLKLYPSA